MDSCLGLVEFFLAFVGPFASLCLPGLLLLLMLVQWDFEDPKIDVL